MIDYSTYCQIHLLHEQKGLKASQIAQELSLSAKTVEQWIAKASFQPRKGSKRSSKLDSFKGQVVAMLERHPYSAQQILQQLQPQGYAGGYSILKEFIRLVRPPLKPAFLMLQFAAGEAAQVDWGQYGIGSGRFHPSPVELLCHGSVLQPDDLRRVHPVRGHGPVPDLSSSRLRVFWFRPAKGNSRQPQGRCRSASHG